MDHQVEDDIDVEASWGEDAEAVDLEEEWKGDSFFECGDSGVEAFEVAYLEDALVLGCQVNQVLCACEVECDWFFDKDVEAGCKELAADFRMGNGWDGYDTGL